MPIKNGDVVKVHYTGKFPDGKVFDSSLDRDPLTLTIGEKMVIPGFEKALVGREKGDKITAEISPGEGYGDRDQELVFAVSRSQVPDHIPLKIGTPLQLSHEKGQMDVTITEIDPEEITLDANHPLAGKDLIFDIEILDVKPGENS